MAEEDKPQLHEEERTIEFYVAEQASSEYPRFDLNKFVEYLTAIPERERNAKLKNRETLFCWYEKGEHLHRFMIGITRSRVRGGAVDMQTSELFGIPLPDGQEACEYSHLIVFPNNIVGIEHNPHGPRLSQFSDFIDQKMGSLMGMVRFKPVANEDFEENLKSVPRFKAVSIMLTDTNAELYGEIDQNFEKLRQQEIARTGANRVRLTWYAARGSDTLREYAEKFARKLMLFAKPKEAYKKMHVKFEGPNKNAVARNIIDLMNAKITTVRNIELMTPISEKRLDRYKAWEAIRSAYDELEKPLEHAVSVDVEIT
jgi:hypothetical protein